MRHTGLILAALLVLAACNTRQEKRAPEDIEYQISLGNFNTASQWIRAYMARTDLSPTELLDWQWKLDWMQRVELDFSKTEDEAVEYISKYYPGVTGQQLQAWEDSRALECMTLNGEKRYFSRAFRNLFRIDSACRMIYESVNGPEADSKDTLLWDHLPRVLLGTQNIGQTLTNPKTYRITYRITVPANTIPDGELLRVWMPLPRTDVSRQTDFMLINTSQPNYIISPDAFAHKSIYMERTTRAGEDAVFEYTFSYKAYAQYHHFNPLRDVKPYDTTSAEYIEFTKERLPHIIKSQRIITLTKGLIGQETNPFLQLQKIFSYISLNYPWAGAREYSTIDCIPLYVLDNRHGDCGQVSLLFISMCRSIGIPARWQSGWMLHPGSENLHDWAEAYIEGVGWIPVDQSFGLQTIPSDKTSLLPEGAGTPEDLRLFFSRGMDAYRMIVNADISGAFFPAKIFPRSETVDFQRGEVEWRGGNLYFDKWDYQLKVESIQ